MEVPNSFTADVTEWRLTQALDSDPTAAPALQASLAFSAGAGPCIARAVRPDSENAGRRLRLTKGRLWVRPGSAPNAILAVQVRGGKADFTVESTLPSAQFDWLLSLVDKLSCSVQLEFELPEPSLRIDADFHSSRELAGSRFWVTRACGADGIDRPLMVSQGLAYRNGPVQSDTRDPRTQLERDAAELLARLLSLQQPGTTTENSTAEWQVDRLRDLIAAATDANDAESATAPPPDDRSERSDSPSTSRPLTQQQAAAGDSQAERVVARTTSRVCSPTASPTQAAARAPAMSAGRSNDEAAVLEPEIDAPRSITLPAWAEHSGIVGSKESSTAPQPVAAREALAAERFQGQPVQPASLRGADEAMGSLAPATLAPQQTSAQTASPGGLETPLVGSLQAAQTLPWNAVIPVKRHEGDGTGSTAPPPLPARARGHPYVNLLALFGAKFGRPRFGLSIAALLVLLVGGYWIFDRSADSTTSSDVASAQSAADATGPPLAVKLPPGPNRIGSTPLISSLPVSRNEVSGMQSDTSAPSEHAGTEGSYSVLVLNAARLRALDSPGQPAFLADSSEQQSTGTVKHQASPRAARIAPSNKRARGSNRGGKATGRNAPDGTESSPPISTIVAAPPAVETNAPAPLPTPKAQTPLPVLAAALNPCSGLRGLKHAQCEACEKEGTASRRSCERIVKIRYCSGKWGDVPDCPWLWESSDNSVDAVKP